MTKSVFLFMYLLSSVAFGQGMSAGEREIERFRVELGEVCELNLNNLENVVLLQDVSYRIAGFALAISDTVQGRLAVDLLDEYLGKIEDLDRAYLALTDAAIAEVYAKSFNEIDRAIELYAQALKNVLELESRDQWSEAMAIPMKYYTFFHGFSMYRYLADTTHSPPEVRDYLFKCRDLEGELARLEEQLQSLGLQNFHKLEAGDLSEPDWLELSVGDTGSASDHGDPVWQQQGLWLDSWLKRTDSTEPIDMALVWFGNRFVGGFGEALDRWRKAELPFLMAVSSEDEFEYELLVPLPPDEVSRSRTIRELHLELNRDFVRKKRYSRHELGRRIEVFGFLATPGSARSQKSIQDTEWSQLTGEEGLDDETTDPKLLEWAKPEYPELVRKARIEGTVIIKVLVGTEGVALEAAILQSVNPLLNQAAMDAALQCRFEPATQRGNPVIAWMAIPFTFRLKSDDEISGEQPE